MSDRQLVPDSSSVVSATAAGSDRQLVHAVSDPSSVASTIFDVFSDSDSDMPPLANDTFAEIYSPPRVGPLVEAHEGHVATLAVDYAPGFCRAGDGSRDLGLSSERHLVMKQLKQKQPRLTVVSPPCTQHR